MGVWAIPGDKDVTAAVRAKPDLLFLFAPDGRPNHAQFRQIVKSVGGLSITVDRAVADDAMPPVDKLWVELQRDGLTFDCSGLAPGPPEDLPLVSDWLAITEEERADRLRSVGLALGPHLRAGQASPPILRGLLGLAADLAEQFADCRGVCWAASGTMIERGAFVDLVRRWQEGASFPIQLVTSFKSGLGGGIESRGLAYFTRQELRIEPGAFADEGQGTLLAMRIAGQLIYRGKLDAAEQAIAPDGRALRLEPSPNGRFVRVWAG